MDTPGLIFCLNVSTKYVIILTIGSGTEQFIRMPVNSGIII